MRPYAIFGGLAGGLSLALWAWLAVRTRRPLLSYLLSVNLITLLMYGYDKWSAQIEALRVPEKVLHGLALVNRRKPIVEKKLYKFFLTY